ncbi:MULTISPECIES: alpha/beta fold hydrolase [Pseudofrankia]|uniref:alpha/beta fold hydrolase n=1 Tax=Pseudofrankia TaxID=2994363 RepID=UPI000234D47E|nr:MULTISPECIES: alpha/beta hydrolase [Pseudofrankia]OHV41947.1 alpha/beta hydrolase [Pseudofrankia sp. EUN1h]
MAGAATGVGGLARGAATGAVDLMGTVAGSKTVRRTGGGLGLAGAVIAAGLIAERHAVRRARALPDVPVEHRPGPLAGRATTVIATDGVPLHVVVSGLDDVAAASNARQAASADSSATAGHEDPGARANGDGNGDGDGDGDGSHHTAAWTRRARRRRSAPDGPTFVFVHGFCNTADSWCFQQRALADLGPMVFYDQRAHGRSGPSEVSRCTIDQLADDLYAVLAATVPTGPVVLIGHSMGGMTILGLAERHPEFFDDRVIAVALLSTSAGDLARVTFGLPAGVTAAVRRVLPGLAVGMRHTPSLFERARLRGSDLAYSITRRVGFGTTDVPPSVVEFLEGEIAGTPISVIGSFLPTLLSHDKLAAAAVLRHVPTLLMVGDHDLMTPLPHSRTLAEALPEAELAVEEGAGHALPLERPDAVNERIRALIARAHPVRRPLLRWPLPGRHEHSQSAAGSGSERES